MHELISRAKTVATVTAGLVFNRVRPDRSVNPITAQIERSQILVAPERQDQSDLPNISCQQESRPVSRCLKSGPPQ